MIDLSDVTFTIPVKIDQPDRTRNIRAITSYLASHFNTNILICEMDKQSKVKQSIDSKIKYKYIFLKTESPWLHRTMMLNRMAKEATTPIIVNYDTDVLLKPEQYVEAARRIRDNESEMVYPYDGNFFDIQRKEDIQKIIRTNSIDGIELKHCQNLRPEGNSVGGVIFWNKKKFLEVGGENENCMSWGFEDDERISRARKLGVKISRVPDPLFHMYHNQSPNSKNGGHPYYQKNEKEYNKVNQMTKPQLENYIKNWSWKCS